MNNQNPSSEGETRNITLKLVIAWAFGSLVGLAGIVLLFSSPVIGIVALVSAVIVFPPTYNFLKNKLRISLSTGVKVTIIIVLFVIGGVISSKETPSTPATTAVNAPVSVPAPAESSSTPAQTQAAPVSQAVVQAPVTPQVLLNISGSGSKSTETFTAAGDWTLSYSYDCSNFGDQGNFQVFIYDSDGSMSFENTGVNQLGSSGSDTEYYHSGGSYYLEVNSECSWKIEVKG